jgi:50S ribosomal protein L16 3-hydroxylase
MPPWLSPPEIAGLVRARQPHAEPGAAAATIPLLGWETFDRVLRSERPLDLMIVAGGVMVEASAPRSLAALQALMRRGVSVVVRASEQHDPGLAALAAAFGEALPGGEVHIQLYATPGGTNAYGWHYDFEDVFIAQTAGAKDYYFRDNTVARETELGDRLDFTCVRAERSPIYSTRLLAGDWLYLPPRWWHLVKGIEDALSISIGVMPAAAFRQARRIPPGWTGPPGDAHA